MMNFKKFLSLFLAVLMLCGGLANIIVIPAAAEDAAETSTGEAEERIDYMTKVFASPEDKIASMKLMTTKGNYSFYVDQHSGEVAVKNLASGQVLFTNPYDVGASNASETIKNELLSQVIVKFTENGRAREYTSYEYAAVKDQIKVKNIKSGVRVEYTIGREEARRLVPRMIEKSRFEEKILAPYAEGFGIPFEEALKMLENIKYVPPGSTEDTRFYFHHNLTAYYIFESMEKYTSDSLKQDKLENYPILSKMDVYILDTGTAVTEVDRLEETIKTYCPDYSYEDMDYDHQLTQFTSEDENPPLFKLALEYKIDEETNSFTVRLPANGLRFNEDKFQITDISVLPYMGAGNNAYEGYTFYPDGSGALFAFEDLADQNTYSVAGKIYGVDYAYHKISGTYQQTVRYPVFGIMEQTRYYDCVAPDEATGEDKTTTISGVIYDAVTATNPDGTSVPVAAGLKTYANLVNSSDVEEYTVNRGFVAIIEEGDALTNLVNYHAGVLSPYDTVQMNFSPRPQDSYNIADAISVGTNSEWTVVSERKYVGNHTVRYIMLTDENKAAANNLKNGSWYESSWLGMAKAYRDYLVGKGVLSPLDKTSENIPLYIESFGAMDTIEKILSIPVEVSKPLTSAKDITTMFEELSAEGVKNINFKLTGFANGGMYSTTPYGLKWEKAVTKDMNMQELFDYAANVTDGDLGIYPDFDFAYNMIDKLFDGFSMRKHAVRTIDDRFSFKREYIATQQRYAGYYQLAVSPAYFSRFYKKLMSKYLTYKNVEGISVASLGNALNSDFDEDEPYNREDSKSFVAKALEYISGGEENKLKVMVDGGNAYTWKYADHILGAALDSSRYIKASYSVPFVGVVLHGYKSFTGSPLNMEGDVNYAKLKAIENGASVYFTLSYQNTQEMKEDFFLNRYYSVRYDIWYDDVVEIYNELNASLADVQKKLIIDHQFLSGMRVPDTLEFDRDITQEFEAVLDYQNNKAEYEEKQKAEAVADARDKIASVESTAKTFVGKCMAYYSGISGAAYMFVTGDRSLERRFASYYEAKAAYDKVMVEYEAADDEGKKEMRNLVATAEATQRQALGQLRTYIRNVGRAIGTIQNEYNALTKLLEEARDGSLLINATEGCPSSIIEEIAVQLENTEKYMNEQLGIVFNHTVDKAEVDTFIYTHIATLLLSCYGENHHASNGVVGKAENIYKMLASKDYGLLISELELLRYLPENREMTDDQIIAKYGLSADKSSVDGLVTYIKELLGDGYKFDPVVEGMENGVEDNIHDYFEYLLYYIITGLNDGSMIPALNFNGYRVENDKQIPNGANNQAVVKQIDKEINAALLDSKTGILGQVTDGKYDLDTYFTADQMKALVEKCVKIINDNIRTQTNPKPTNPVVYLTPDTMEYDLTQYIRGYYFREVINRIAPNNGKVSLLVRTVSYKTDSSMGLLVTLRNEAYTITNPDNEYAEMLELMYNDTEVEKLIAQLNDSLKDTYGDISDNLRTAFYRAFAERLLGTDKAPTMPKKDRVDPADAEKKIALRDEAAPLIEGITAKTTYEEAKALVAQLVAICANYELGEDYDAVVGASNYIYYYYLQALAGMEAKSYYFDEQMSKMDAAVIASVEARKAAILAALPEGFTVYDLYDKVTASIADPENAVLTFAKEQAAQITHTATGGGKLEDDILKYYCYLLYNGFDGYELGDAPTLSSIDEKKVKNAIKVLDNDLKDRIPELLATAKSKAERGTTPDYALTSFLTAEEIRTIGNELVDALIEALFATEADREVLYPEVQNYFNHKYTMAVTTKLFDNKLPSFHVSEVYGSTLQDSVQSLKDIMYYYVTTFTDMTAEDIDNLAGGYSNNGSEGPEDEASRYLSDDGRIVSVTYGDQNADGSYSAYKTFILNYNNFSVNVEYADITYTIPAYGYVIVMQ